MTSSSLVILIAVVAMLATSTFTIAFSPIAPYQTKTSSSSSAISMGIFDSISKAFGNEEYGAPPDAVKATARHILVPTLDEANMVLGEIAKGETSFASLASQYSTCPSKSQGGSLGSFGPGTMVKEFDAVVFNPDTNVGEVKGPIQTQFGYHLLVVDKRKADYNSTVLEKDWLKESGVTIIASGSDQPTKQEIPNDVLAASKYIADLTKQTSKVGELRGAIQAGLMSEEDVYAELGEIVNGDKPGREGNEIIVVDLTGTGAQDAAIGQVAWDKLGSM